MAEEANPIDSIENPEDILSINHPPLKRKRKLPGSSSDPQAEVISLSPKTLMATNRFLCDTCGKGFQRDQNLQLHRRGHNLPWKLKQRMGNEPRKIRVYVCPEKSCVHNHPSRALGDLTGIKKHFYRKHGEKRWRCEKCSKMYAVQSDWKAHSKTCGTREYKCNCGTIFSRRDSFLTHKAFCDALAEETARVNAANSAIATNTSDANPMSANLNYQFIGPPLIPGMAQIYFSSIFKQFSSHTNSGNVIDPTNQQNILQTPAHQLQVPLSSESSSIYDNIIDHQVDNSNHQLNWVLGDKLVDAQNVDRELSNAKNTNLFSNFEAKNGGNGLVSLPPLYTSTCQTIRHDDEDYNIGEQTRDFLGVGVQPICYPSSLSEWI